MFAGVSRDRAACAPGQASGEDRRDSWLRPSTRYDCIAGQTYSVKQLKLIFAHRVSPLLSGSGNLLDSHDLPRRPRIWKAKPSHLHFDLFHRGVCVSDVYQGVWYRGEVDTWGQQSIRPRIDLRICDRDRVLHSYSNELF